MKRILAKVVGATILAGLTSVSFAAAPRGSARLTLNGKSVSVEYGRPSLNGQTVNDLLGQLAVGECWRLGADKSTTFSSSGDLVFGDVTVPKGEYSLWVRREIRGWSLVFNRQHGQWGTRHDPAQDFASVALKEEKLGRVGFLKLTIAIESEKDGGQLSIQWGDMELSTAFR
jgi:hypothetical protein